MKIHTTFHGVRVTGGIKAEPTNTKTKQTKRQRRKLTMLCRYGIHEVPCTADDVINGRFPHCGKCDS